MVCIDRTPRDWTGDSVTANNERGAYLATQHLVKLGHTRLTMIAGPLYLTNARERLDGYKRALREAHLHPRP